MAAAKLKNKAAAAARASAEKQARVAKIEQRLRALNAASIRSAQPIREPVTATSQHSHAGTEQAVSDDAGLLTRTKAFLSLRGFNTAGIASVHPVSTQPKTYRDRRLIAAASSRQQVVQARLSQPPPPLPPPKNIQTPKLKTVARPDPKVEAERARLQKSTARKQRQHLKPLLSPRRQVGLRDRGTSTLLPLAGIHALRRGLGLLDGNGKLEDAVYVAIDTEGFRDVTEIGISTLDTRDIAGITPDFRAENWISKVEHQHLITAVRATTPPGRGGLFCTARPCFPSSARNLLLTTLRRARQTTPSSSPRKVHLVGQSIASDIALLKRSPTISLDLSHGSEADFTFDTVFDTSELAVAAREEQGAHFTSIALGKLAQRLGVDPKYWFGPGVVGSHNASNDAAYTMMVLLLLAVRWEGLGRELTRPEPVTVQGSEEWQADSAKKLRKRQKMRELKAAAVEQRRRFWEEKRARLEEERKRMVWWKRIMAVVGDVWYGRTR